MFPDTIPFYASGFIFSSIEFVSDCHNWAFLLLSRYAISVALRLLLISEKDFGREAECNQDFGAPAPWHILLWAAGLVTPFVTPAACHMPFEVVSVRMREHQHWERTPSGVVFWTGSERDAVGIVRRNERMKEFRTEAEGRPQGAVKSTERWTEKLSNTQNK